MHKGMAALSLAVIVAACGGSKDVNLTNASVEDVAKASKEAQKLDPGQWSTTVEIVSVDVEGMPEKDKAVAQAMFQRMVGQKNTMQHCVTPEEAEKAPTEMLAGGKMGDCTFDKYALNGGKLDAAMHCAAPQGQQGKMAMTMSGTFGAQAYELQSKMTMEGATGAPGGQGKMVITAKNSAKRVGDCKKEDAKS